MKIIAIIEDDQMIGDLLEEILVKEGYGVRRAYSGTEALYLLSQQRPDLVLLDLMLPGLSGEQVLKKISGIPTIVVSAKVGVDDKVRLLLDGAVDYITKPFEIRELLARIQVQLRKSSTPSLPVYQSGELAMNTLSREVSVGKTPVHLTKTEYAILKLLLQNPTQTVAKSVMLDRIAEDTPDCTEGSLKQHVSNLRKKLKDAGNKDYIQAVWGIGFRLNTDSKNDPR